MKEADLQGIFSKTIYLLLNTNDLLTHSNTQEAIQNKMIFNLYINLKEQIIKGKVKIFFKCLKPTNKFILDIKLSNYLKAFYY